MKNDYLSEIISDIDEKFIDEAAYPKKSRSRTYSFVALAACVTVFASAGLLYSNGFFEKAWNDINVTELDGNNNIGADEIVNSPASDNVTRPAMDIIQGEGEITEGYYEETTAASEFIELTTQTAEIAVIPQWNEKKISEKFPEAVFGGKTYSVSNGKTDEEFIGNYLGEAELTGYDIYEDKTHSIKAYIYEIKDISGECAVAVKFEGTEGYYPYLNHYYIPKTLGDMVTDLNLRNTLSFSVAYMNIYQSDRRIYRKYNDFDDNIVWEKLLTDLSSENVSCENLSSDELSISVDISVLGIKNLSFAVTSDGYIKTNLLATQKVFFVGKEKTEAFRNYLTANVEFAEKVTVYEAYNNAVAGGVGETVEGVTSPAYIPENMINE